MRLGIPVEYVLAGLQRIQAELYSGANTTSQTTVPIMR